MMQKSPLTSSFLFYFCIVATLTILLGDSSFFGGGSNNNNFVSVVFANTTTDVNGTNTTILITTTTTVDTSTTAPPTTTTTESPTTTTTAATTTTTETATETSSTNSSFNTTTNSSMSENTTSSTNTTEVPTNTTAATTTTTTDIVLTTSSITLEPTNTTTTITTTVTTTTTPEPTPSPPTPVPSTMIQNTTLSRLQYAAGFGSFLSGLIAMPSASFSISRSMALLSLSHCTLDDVKLTFPTSLGPFLQFGEERGRYLRGSIIGNVAVIVVLFIILLVVGIVVPTESWDQVHDTKFGQMLNTGRVLSLTAVVYSVLLDGIISSSITLGRVSDTVSRDALLATFGFFFAIGFGIFLFYQLRQLKEKVRPLAYMDCEIRSDVASYETKQMLNGEASKFLLVGRMAWVPADENRQTEFPPEANRAYHIWFHYRDLGSSEGNLNVLMPYYFFVDAALTALVAIFRGMVTPCVANLWAVFAFCFATALLAAIYRPYSVPLFNLHAALQNFVVSLAALMIQSGIGEDDGGRAIGEFIAIGCGIFGFLPALVILIRTVLLWHYKGGWARITKELDSDEKDHLQQEMLAVAKKERQAAAAAELEALKPIHIGGVNSPLISTNHNNNHNNDNSHQIGGALGNIAQSPQGFSPIQTNTSNNNSQTNQSGFSRQRKPYDPLDDSDDDDLLFGTNTAAAGRAQRNSVTSSSPPTSPPGMPLQSLPVSSVPTNNKDSRKFEIDSDL